LDSGAGSTVRGSVRGVLLTDDIMYGSELHGIRAVSTTSWQGFAWIHAGGPYNRSHGLSNRV